MRVAIVGAGLSGLACAYELQRCGITPDIYEKKNYLGDELINTSAMLKLFNRPCINPRRYLKKKYRLDISPLFPVREVVLSSPNRKIKIAADLGYIFPRGRGENSLANQIAANVNAPVLYNNYVYLGDVKNKYDCVVAATGEDSYAKGLNAWNANFNAQIRIAYVLGDFKTDRIEMWLNTKYAGSGYCFLIPNSCKQAQLTLIVTNIAHDELDHYWKELLAGEGADYKIIETRDYEYNGGYSTTSKIENVYFVGNAGGFVDDIMGFGSLNAIESGILAARSIAKGLDYNKLAGPILKEVKKLHQYRMAMNTFGDEDFDKLVAFLGFPGIKQSIYKNPLIKARHGIIFARVYNSLRKDIKI